MKRIILTGYGYKIGKKGDLLVINRADGKSMEVSVGNVGQVIAHASGLSISGDALRLMLRHGVSLILISRYRPLAKLQPFRGGVSVKLKKEQLYAQLDNRCVSISRSIVSTKIYNQLNIVRWLRRSRLRRDRVRSDMLVTFIDKLKALYNRSRSIKLGNERYRERLLSIEAEAGRIYWGAISVILPSEIEFDGRKKRFERPSDPFNLSLNYLYTLLASQVWTAIELAGLDPWIGYYHMDSSRRPSLVMDLMEEFRQPIVDKPLINMFLSDPNYENMITKSNELADWLVKELSKVFFEKLDERRTFRNRSLPISGHISLQPRRLAKYILRKEPGYFPYDVT